MRQRSVKAELAALDGIFRALAHESRRQIVLVLHYRGGRMTAGQIADRFACSWPTTTRHLRVLEASGLVSVRQSGRERVYELNRKRLHAVLDGWLKHTR